MVLRCFISPLSPINRHIPSLYGFHKLKQALITGISGQDGSYLTEFLVEHGYQVRGTAQTGGSSPLTDKIRTIAKIDVIDLADTKAFIELIRATEPDEIYHLASPTFVAIEKGAEAQTLSTVINSTRAILEAATECAKSPRLFFAGTSEMFGATTESPQREDTAFNPRNIYGVAKRCAHEILRFYRQTHGLYACTGIMFNHESPRRQPKFVTRKITLAAARIARGLDHKVVLGNLESARDWGYAPEYVDAAWRMLQNDTAKDYVIATGKLTTIREFVSLAFAQVNLNPSNYIDINPSFVRPSEAVPLRGDSTRIRRELGWKPVKTIEDVVAEMVDADLALLDLQGESEMSHGT